MRRHRSQRGHRKEIIAVAIATSIAAIGWVLGVSAAQQSTVRSELYPWAFPGATTVYSGSANTDGVSFSEAYSFHVLAVNSTKAEVSIYDNTTVDGGPPKVNHDVSWIPALRTGPLPFMFNSGDAGVAQYLTRQVTNLVVQGKSVSVTSYTLDLTGQGDLTVTAYFASNGYAPVGYKMVTSGLPTVTLRIVSTNVPGLLP